MRPRREEPVTPRPVPDTPLASALSENRDAISKALGDSPDLVLRDLRLGPDGPDALVACFSGLVDDRLVASSVVEPVSSADLGDPARREPEEFLETLRLRYLGATAVTEVGSMRPLLHRLAGGECVLLVDGSAKALSVLVGRWRERRPADPQSESTVRGPRDAFIETLAGNLATLRHRLKHPDLRFEKSVVGRATLTDVVIAYIDGLSRKSIVREVRRRIERVDIDGVLESGELEEFIEDEPLSPFPQVLRTERPDRVAGALLEGRVAIIVDGTPFAMIVPATLTMFLTSPEDHYERPFLGTFLRLLRYVAFAVSMLLPSLYVAVTTFHQEMLPTTLILSIAAQRRGVPVPAIVEAFLLEMAFELFREAALRLPRIIGPAIAIAGTVVIGEAAARAGLVSPIMVVAVALTGISSFAVPVYSAGISIRLIRFPLLFLSATLGVFGLVAGLSLLLTHMCALRSFGVPYMSPLAPSTAGGLKDSLIVAPLWLMRRRPLLVSAARTQVGQGGRPRPPRRRPTGGRRK